MMHEIEISEQVGSVLWGLRKGAGHKYIRRVPKPSGGYRYYYRTSGVTRAVAGEDLRTGAKFKITHEGRPGHFEVVDRFGDTLTLRHDESGGTMEVSAAQLGRLLQREHADVVQAARSSAIRRVEAARKHGTAKQVARMEAQARNVGVGGLREQGVPPHQAASIVLTARLGELYANKALSAYHRGDEENTQYYTDIAQQTWSDLAYALRQIGARLDNKKLVEMGQSVGFETKSGKFTRDLADALGVKSSGRFFEAGDIVVEPRPGFFQDIEARGLVAYSAHDLEPLTASDHVPHGPLVLESKDRAAEMESERKEAEKRANAKAAAEKRAKLNAEKRARARAAEILKDRHEPGAPLPTREQEIRDTFKLTPSDRRIVSRLLSAPLMTMAELRQIPRGQRVRLSPVLSERTFYEDDGGPLFDAREVGRVVTLSDAGAAIAERHGIGSAASIIRARDAAIDAKRAELGAR